MNKKNILDKEYIIMLILWLFSILIRGYKFGVSNHISYVLPYIYKIQDNSLYTKDFIFNYKVENSFFFDIIGKLSNYINLEILMFSIYLIFSFLFILAIYKISYLLFENKYISYIAILLLITPKPTLGTDQTFRIITLPIMIAIPIILFSLYYFLKSKFIHAFLLLGVAFNIHGLSSIHILATYILYSILKFKSINKKKFFFGLLIFLMIITPLLIQSSETTKLSFYNADKEWYNSIRSIDKSHIFLSNWTINKFLLTIPLIVIGLLLLIYYKKNKTQINIYSKRTAAIIFGLIILTIIGTLFAEIYPIEIIMILQLLRSNIFLIILILIYISNFIYELIKQKDYLKKISSMLIFLSLFLYDYVVSITLLPLTVYFMLYKKQEKHYKILLFYLIFTIISIILIPDEIINKIFTHYKNSIIVTLLTLSFFIIYNKYKNIELKKFLFISGLMLLLATTILVISLGKTFNNHIQFPKKINLDARTDMEVWISKNTEKDSLFLIPPHLSTFRMNTKRSIFYDYISTAGVFFSKDFAKEWKSRLNELGLSNCFNDIECTEKVYNDLKEENINYLKNKYKITHAVFRIREELPYKIIYLNSEFIVYCLEC